MTPDNLEPEEAAARGQLHKLLCSDVPHSLVDCEMDVFATASLKELSAFARWCGGLGEPVDPALAALILGKVQTTAERLVAGQ